MKGIFHILIVSITDIRESTKSYTVKAPNFQVVSKYAKKICAEGECVGLVMRIVNKMKVDFEIDENGNTSDVVNFGS